MTRKFVVEVEIGALRSTLFIHDGAGHGTHLNLIWRDTERPIDRADKMLQQNGYERTGAWVDQAGGFKAQAKADGDTSSCSCWLQADAGAVWIEQVGHGCPDHRSLWKRAS